MEINVILTEIKSRFPTANVVCIYKTGSTLFCNNCKDIDVVAICDNVNFVHGFFKLNDINIDVGCNSKSFEWKSASGSRQTRGLAIALATGDNLLYGELPFEDYSWDKYKGNVLKEEYNLFYRRLLRMARRSGTCLKPMTWAFATYFACINGTLNFTAEQREILQKCHDLQLPVSYAEELKNNIESKLKEWGLLK